MFRPSRGGADHVDGDASLQYSLNRYTNVATRMLGGESWERDPKQHPISSVHMDELYRRARDVLFHKVAWYGITDMWNESVCLFHAELGGAPRLSDVRTGALPARPPARLLRWACRPSQRVRRCWLTPAWQTLNSRPGTPPESGLDPDAVASIREHERWDIRLYKEAHRRFVTRAKRHNCL